MLSLLQPAASTAATSVTARRDRADMRPTRGEEREVPASLAVRHPDVLHVRSRAEELTAFAIVGIEPVAIVPRGPRALHVRGRRGFHGLYSVARAEIPHRLDVVVLS